MSYWGYHLMLDCAECNDGIKDKENIILFVKELVKEIDMVAHGEPVVEYLLPGDPKQGYSMMQLITTSNICAHFIEPDYTAYFDIFSCKEYDIEVAKRVVQKYFGANKMKVTFLTRQA
jgi:S-adenosylmethionine/arginine decarboxylase-like enzyme